jgi:hypothetical protein
MIFRIKRLVGEWFYIQPLRHENLWRVVSSSGAVEAPQVDKSTAERLVDRLNALPEDGTPLFIGDRDVAGVRL